MTIIAEATRGGFVESVHRGAWVVADAAGAIVASGGDATRPVFPRSAIKALQALPLLVDGAADRFGLTDAELALACASHAGCPEHTETAAAMLEKAGRDAGCLECGTHWPSSATAARALAASGAAPGPLHNNCSGKHAGFVCGACAAGIDPASYVRPDHPLMRRVTQAVGAVLGIDLAAAPHGTDGCSIPTYQVPLVSIAAGFARFGVGTGIPEGFAAAAARLRRAVAANPVMIAGRGRFDTEVTEALGEAAFVKIGAEGVEAGALPGLGLGFAIKTDDGAGRAAEAAAASLIRRFLGPNPALDRWAKQPLTNWNGIQVGELYGTLETGA